MNALISAQDILKAMTKKSYAVLEDDSKPFHLNIVGVRSAYDKVNAFDDVICVFWKYKGGWSLIKSVATTDPGLYWMNNPERIEGTAIFKPQQVVGMWAKGFHKGDPNRPALVQVQPCVVYRDANKDNKHDFGGNEQKGLFGINLHSANAVNESIQVDKWSAGCQVNANPEEHKLAMWLADQHIKNWGNSFNYALLNEGDL